MTFEELRVWRKKWKLTLVELAILTGCSSRTISTWRKRGVPQQVMTFCMLFDDASHENQMALLRKAWSNAEKEAAA